MPVSRQHMDTQKVISVHEGKQEASPMTPAFFSAPTVLPLWKRRRTVLVRRLDHVLYAAELGNNLLVPPSVHLSEQRE